MHATSNIQICVAHSPSDIPRDTSVKDLVCITGPQAIYLVDYGTSVQAAIGYHTACEKHHK